MAKDWVEFSDAWIGGCAERHHGVVTLLNDEL